MPMLTLLLAGQLAAASAVPPPPAAPPSVHAASETHFGITLQDPDRWLEDLKSKDAQDWIRAQADRTRSVLDAIPARAQVLADVERLENTTASNVDAVVLMRGERLLIQRQDAGQDVAKLYLREGWEGKDRLLLDPEDWRKRTGKPHAMNYAEPSPDGRHAVVGLSESGSEMASAYVIDLATGKVVEGPISRVRFGISWLPDSSAFFYNRENEVGPGMNQAEHQLNSQAYLHTLGQDIARDRLVFGNRYDASLGIAPGQLPIVIASAESDWLIGMPASVDNRLTLFAAPRSELGGERIHWRKLVGSDEQARSFVIHDNALYLLTARKPNREIERFALADGKRTTVVAEGALPLDEVYYSGNALYYTAKTASGVGMELDRLPWQGGKPSVVALPGMDSVFPYAVQDKVDGIVVGGVGWAHFADVMRIDGAGRVHATNLQPPPAGMDASQLEATIVQVPSYDGALVPLSIVHRRDLKRDGNNPTFLQGYGAYGISTNPALVPAHFAYFDRGFVRAFCHVRGGGEKGEAWYRAGFQATKANTWKDFIACADYLVREKYTSPSHLGISGGSAGGILIGNALIERPDLFGAVMPQVGVLDSVGAALRDPNGPVNWPEFGDPNTEDGFKSLVGMSAYQKVHDGTPFPAVMLSHGFNDPRVAVWHSAKMASRLQHASNSGKPVLLNIDYDSGHGIGSTQSSVNRERADLISFMLWQFGVEGYAPAPATNRQAGK
ncbi:prolyl oligopeptidase family serine peptidase [Lysobacter rhizosphaerae]